MRTVLFMSFIAACEQVTPAGNPLKPVVVKAESAAEESTEVPDGTPLEEDEVFSISSEEMQAIAEGKDPSVPGETPADVAEETAPVDLPAAASAVAKEHSPPPESSVTQGWPKQVADAWPVRLVTTVPNASPPRAILGLPDGREVVVNPGSMVPDLGLVVVAISPNSAEIAKILPAGDHATIESMTLTAQY
jgi:hypothetical protein